MQDGYPIVLTVRDRRIVIVGGGNVAQRKVRGLLESGAGDMAVIAPSIHPDIPETHVDLVHEKYRPEHLIGASLVFAATDDPAVNEQIVRDAHAIGALVCRADVDDTSAGDFSTPAMLRQGPLLVTVSSGGSPALSAKIRDGLGRAIEPRWVQMAEAMKTLRPVIRASLEPKRRTEAFRMLCTDEAMQELSRGGVDGLKAWLMKSFVELKD